MGTHTSLDPRSALAPLAVALMLGFSANSPALAQEEGSAPKRDKVIELLEKLKDKGIISQEEFDELTDNTPEGRAASRAERRARVQKEAIESQKAEAARERYNGRWNNGINFETPDRRTSFSLGGRIHGDYRSYDEATQADTFDIRRAYLTLQGKWNEWITWDMTGDFAQNGVALDVGWVNAAIKDSVQVRVGQFKMPFSLEELTSSRFLDFQERSMVNVLVPAKERGMMIHGIPATGMTYGLAVSNGQGKNGNETVQVSEGLDVIGRATVNVAELLGRQAIAVGHLGIAASVGDQPTGGFSRLSFRNNEIRGVNFFRTDPFTGQPQRRERLGIEGAAAYGPFKLQGEMVKVNYSGRSAAGVSYDRAIDSHYISALWMITGERYAETYRNGVFGRMSPISNFEPGGSGWGAWELGLRFSQFDASDFKTTNPAGTGRLANFTIPATIDGAPVATVTTNKATSFTVGLKWLWTPNFRWYLNYVVTRYDTPITVAQGGIAGVPATTLDSEKTIMLRAAFDW